VTLKKSKNFKTNENIEQEQDQNEPVLVQNRFLRWLLITLGTISVGLGVIGIFLPVLPTTPFLLLAAWCYSRSSEKYYKWLINNKWFGKYIKSYREGNGIPIKVKITAISLLWLTILISIIFIVTNFYIRLIMLVVAVLVSIHIISIKPKK